MTEINFGQRTGVGQGRTRGAEEFAEIYFGMGLRWRWATEMNFGQRAGTERGRVCRNSFRHGLGEDMGRPK